MESMSGKHESYEYELWTQLIHDVFAEKSYTKSFDM